MYQRFPMHLIRRILLVAGPRLLDSSVSRSRCAEARPSRSLACAGASAPSVCAHNKGPDARHRAPEEY